MLKNEVLTIGMLEYWNGGMMGLKEFYLLKMIFYPLFYPIFHYSNIPLFQ